MKYKDILLYGLQITAQLKTFHWQTSDNAKHELFESLLQEFQKKNDQLIQVIMGNIDKKIGVGNGQIFIKNITNINVEDYLEAYASFYQDVSNFLNSEAENGVLSEDSINDIVYDIINIFRRGLYLIRQQSKIKHGTIVNEMKKTNNQLLIDLLKQYKASLKQTLIPKPNDRITIDMKKFSDIARKQGTAGKHWLTIVKNMLKNSGNNTLLVHKVNGKQVTVSGSKYDAFLGTATIPVEVIKSIVKQTKIKNKSIFKEANNKHIQIGKEYIAKKNYMTFHRGDKIFVLDKKSNYYQVTINGRNCVNNAPYKVSEQQLIEAIKD